MKFTRAQNKKEWDAFVKEHGPRSGAFLHSWDYQSLSPKTHAFSVENKGRTVGALMGSITKLPLGMSYVFIQRGPILSDTELTQDVLKHVASELGVTFVRFEPTIKPEHAKRTIDMSPKQTLLLDLQKSDETLLSEMHQKTRYNIRLADKRGVEVREVTKEERPAAWKVFDETAVRQSFRLHKRRRYEDWLETYPGARLVGGYVDGCLAAVNLMVDYAGVRTYLHGASCHAYRKSMAPYAIHWSEIQNAKKEGLHTYDFWGISDENEAWKGITRFKRGFGGEEVLYPGTYDWTESPLAYQVYKILRWVRRRGK